MIARTPARPTDPRPPRRKPARNKPRPERFAALRLNLEKSDEGFPWAASLALAALLSCGASAAFLRPSAPAVPESAESIFVLEEEPTPPPEAIAPPPPPPPAPAPLPPPPQVEETPPPQFGLEEEDLGESGDLAVAAGNTVMKEAEPELAPPPPPLPPAPPAPEFVDQAPRILSGAPPEYPARALDRNLEATVVVLISIDTNGAVTAASIEKSGGLDFDGAVLKSARATRFQPPLRQGRKVPARFRRPYEFKLE